jgi:hypothetical protein
MGVRFDRVLDAFEGPFERVTAEVAPPPGRLEGSARPAGFLISHHQNDAFIAVNRLLAADESVYWLRDRTTGSAGGTGSMYVPSGRSARRILERAAADLGLTVVGVGRVPAGEMLQLTRVRVALVDVYGGSASSGWIRWLLERYEFPFAVVDRDDIDTGRGARGFDVWILPSDVAPGRSASDALKQLAEAGATVLAIGQGASAFARLAALPVSSAPVEALADGTTRPLPRDQFFIPGSVLRVAVDNTTPLAYGFEREVDVFFDDGPVFRFAGPQRGTRAAWFHTAAPLRSGWALGQRYLEGGLAAVDLPVGRGRILLFGPEITYRAQPHGSFKFLFNGIYYGSAVDERP